MPGGVEQHHEGEDQQKYQRQHDQIGFEGRLVHGRGNAEGAAGQPDGQAFNLAVVFGDPFARHVNGTTDGLALAILVVEHQVGDAIVGIVELVQRPGNRARCHVGKHQAADVVRFMGDLEPAWIVVVHQPVDLLDQVRQTLAATDRRIGQHVRLQVLQGAQNLGLFQPAFLGVFGDDVQLFGAGETVIHFLGRQVVVVVRVEDG